MKRNFFLLLLVFIITGCLYPPSTSLHQVLSSANAKSQATEDPLTIKAKQTIDALISPTPDMTKESFQIATIVFKTLEAMKPTATGTPGPADMMATNVSGTIAALKSEIDKNSKTLTAQAVSTSTLPPPPNLFVLPTAQPTVPTVPVIPCDKMSFVADVTVPDGTVMKPGQAFQKIWRIKNAGSCTWIPGYQFTFVDGYMMGTTQSVPIVNYVAPQGAIDIPVNMVAPNAPGKYRSYWRMRNDKGVLFGMQKADRDAVWVEIIVGEEQNFQPPQPPSGSSCEVLDVYTKTVTFIDDSGPTFKFNAIVTLKNTGGDVWSKDNVDFAFVRGSESSTDMYFNAIRYDLPYSISPGQSITFSEIGGILTEYDPESMTAVWALMNNGTTLCEFSFEFGQESPF